MCSHKMSCNVPKILRFMKAHASLSKLLAELLATIVLRICFCVGALLTGCYDTTGCTDSNFIEWNNWIYNSDRWHNCSRCFAYYTFQSCNNYLTLQWCICRRKVNKKKMFLNCSLQMIMKVKVLMVESIEICKNTWFVIWLWTVSGLPVVS